jgi:DNA-binding NtrC family response regulator
MVASSTLRDHVHLLLVDEDSTTQLILEDVCAGQHWTLRRAATASEALRLFNEHRPDVVLMDLRLPDLPGIEVLRRLRDFDGTVPVLVVSGQQDSTVTIDALRNGGFDYLTKPIDVPRLISLVRNAIKSRRVMAVPVSIGPTANELVKSDSLVGMSVAMQEVYKAIARASTHDLTVLIQGETGTGKELVARAIYQHSRRARGPFFAVNCAAIPEALLESELFGHVKGAFTGADQQRVGRFEQAAGGTILLDEIGDMPLSLQAKLLRVLQDKTFQRLGGTETINPDVRILAATHQDLLQLTALGKFRIDLYYRLACVTIKLPPLRERLEDIPALVSHFIAKRSDLAHGRIQRIDPKVVDLLRTHDWPGNVRELENVINQALLNSRGPELLPEHLPALKALKGYTKTSDERWIDINFINGEIESGTSSLYADCLAEFERELLWRVMDYVAGNQSRAAAILGITRATLRAKLRKLSKSSPQP